jgi:hypothetical protein
MNENKPPVYLLTGLIIGLGLGLLVSVLLFPAKSGAGAPAQLNSEDKNIYRGLVAQAFSVDSNLQRASARLALLEEEQPGQALAAEAQRMLAEGKSLAEAEILARLASALQGAVSTQNPAGAAVTAIPLFTPDATGAALTAEPGKMETPLPADAAPPAILNQPTPSPAPTLGAPFILAERKIICEPGQMAGMIEVQVEDSSKKPVPGVRIDISWASGQDFFFTGLIPSVNAGFADFTMTPGEEYSLRVGDGGEQVRGLNIPECSESDGGRNPGSVYLRFIQP